MAVTAQGWIIIVQSNQNQVMTKRLCADTVSDHYMGQGAITPTLHNWALQALNIPKKIQKYPCFCNQFWKSPSGENSSNFLSVDYFCALKRSMYLWSKVFSTAVLDSPWWTAEMFDTAVTCLPVSSAIRIPDLYRNVVFGASMKDCSVC